MQAAGAHRTATSTHVPAKKGVDHHASSTDLFDVFLFFAFVVLVPIGWWVRRQRRARMTPQERATDDQLTEMRKLRRAVERMDRY